MLLKKIFWFLWREKQSDSEFLSYNLMLHSGKIYVVTRVLSEKKILNETKNHNPPPLQVKCLLHKEFSLSVKKPKTKFWCTY
jgi:hypothetical protein